MDTQLSTTQLIEQLSSIPLPFVLFSVILALIVYALINGVFLLISASIIGTPNTNFKTAFLSSICLYVAYILVSFTYLFLPESMDNVISLILTNLIIFFVSAYICALFFGTSLLRGLAIYIVSLISMIVICILIAFLVSTMV